ASHPEAFGRRISECSIELKRRVFLFKHKLDCSSAVRARALLTVLTRMHSRRSLRQAQGRLFDRCRGLKMTYIERFTGCYESELSLHLLRTRSALNVQRADFSFFILHKLNSKIGTEDEELGFRFRDHFEFLSVGFEEELVTFLHHRERLVGRQFVTSHVLREHLRIHVNGRNL